MFIRETWKRMLLQQCNGVGVELTQTHAYVFFAGKVTFPELETSIQFNLKAF